MLKTGYNAEKIQALSQAYEQAGPIFWGSAFAFLHVKGLGKHIVALVIVVAV